MAPETYDRDALSALHELAAWTAGLVWQDRDGNLCYGTANHRAIKESGILPAEAVLDGIEWASTYLEVVNHITVTWNDKNNQNQTTYRDDESIAKWGIQHRDIETRLRTQLDTDEYAYTILSRRAEPWWVIPGIVVDGHTTPDPDYWTSNLLDVGMGILLDVTADPATALDGVAAWTVEGWVERWDTDGTRQTLQFAVSDRTRWGAYRLRRWNDLRAESWEHWRGMSWLDVITGDN
jgi:hypothetical protein